MYEPGRSKSCANGYRVLVWGIAMNARLSRLRPVLPGEVSEGGEDVFQLLLVHTLVASDEKPSTHNEVCVRIPIWAFFSVHIPESRLAKDIA